MTVFEPLNIGEFMKNFLLTETFEPFVVVEASIIGAFRVDFDGALTNGFSNNGVEKFIQYSKLRKVILYLIQGDKPPLSFKIVLAVSQSNLATYVKKHNEEFETVIPTGLFINIKFENGKLLLTSGCSTDKLDLDRIVDKAWDLSLRNFLENHKLI